MDSDIEGMKAAIGSLQRVVVRLEADMLELKAVTPEARFRMFKVLETESERRDAELFAND